MTRLAYVLAMILVFSAALAVVGIGAAGTASADTPGEDADNVTAADSIADIQDDRVYVLDWTDTGDGTYAIDIYADRSTQLYIMWSEVSPGQNSGTGFVETERVHEGVNTITVDTGTDRVTMHLQVPDDDQFGILTVYEERPLPTALVPPTPSWIGGMFAMLSAFVYLIYHRLMRLKGNPTPAWDEVT